ncbi:hypothetical protein XCR_2908 [Xanthomonas campestris pv. raphani 756C]|nr:hypothetical protein XCR_2908 [Xanthomonas campestris pv. raphani 756C]
MNTLFRAPENTAETSSLRHDAISARPLPVANLAKVFGE